MDYIIKKFKRRTSPLPDLSPPTAAAPSSICVPQFPTSTPPLVQIDAQTAVLSQARLSQALDVTAPSSLSSWVWTQALEIVKKKLSDDDLSSLNLINLSSQSAEENIEAVVEALQTSQEYHHNKRLSYFIMERLGKILKYVQKYSKVVGTAISSNPEVSALVWAGVLAMIQVCI